MHRRLHQPLLLLLFLVGAAPSVNSQKLGVNDKLAISDYKTLPLVIEDMPNGMRLNLTEEAVRNRIELRMRTAGLQPVQGSGPLPLRYLYVNVSISTGSAFVVSLQFQRYATWVIDSDKVGSGTVGMWGSGTVGAASSGDVVLEAVDKLVDGFLNAYLKANQDDK
jgi:hypothetical protein